LKAVHYWLDQNSKALGATIQALEVQKMTLATLKGMNFNLGDVANAFKLKAADSMASGMKSVGDRAASTAKTISDVAASVGGSGKSGKAGAKSKPASGIAGLVDPLQLWGSLTQQFQQIASSAMKDATRNTALDATKNMATGFAKEALKATKKAASNATKSRTAPKKTVRRTTR
jgi:hypothetical protein